MEVSVFCLEYFGFWLFYILLVLKAESWVRNAAQAGDVSALTFSVKRIFAFDLAAHHLQLEGGKHIYTSYLVPLMRRCPSSGEKHENGLGEPKVLGPFVNHKEMVQLDEENIRQSPEVL